MQFFFLLKATKSLQTEIFAMANLREGYFTKKKGEYLDLRGTR
jgi:hypothetical protein